MRWTVLLAEILLSLNNYRLRSLLTAIGVIIGVCSVFLTLNISNYITNTLNKELIPISKILVILPQPIMVNGLSRTIRKASSLTSQDSDDIEQLSFVDHSTPVMLLSNMQAVSSYSNIGTIVIGSKRSYFDIVNLSIGFGNAFTNDDVITGQKVAVIGAKVAEQLFPQKEALGQNIVLRNISFRVIGVIKKQGPTIDGKERDNLIVIPITTSKQRFFNNFNANNAVDYILLSVNNSKYILDDQVIITDLLMKNHKITSINVLDFKVENREKEVNSINFIFHTVSFSLILIGAITLVVSGIGISTLMLMSISERKHEIGLKKALGASDNQILIQILLEAITISVFGGLIGSILGVEAILVFNKYTNLNIINSYFYIIPCSGIAILLGIASGIFPAYLTIKIQPINALNEQH